MQKARAEFTSPDFWEGRLPGRSLHAHRLAIVLTPPRSASTSSLCIFTFLFSSTIFLRLGPWSPQWGPLSVSCPSNPCLCHLSKSPSIQPSQPEPLVGLTDSTQRYNSQGGLQGPHQAGPMGPEQMCPPIPEPCPFPGRLGTCCLQLQRHLLSAITGCFCKLQIPMSRAEAPRRQGRRPIPF